MPNYEYQSLTGQGERRGGVITASSRADAVQRILARGETATAVAEVDANGAPSPKNGQSPARDPKKYTSTSTASGSSAPRAGFSFGPSQRPSMKRADLATLIREIATAIEAGLPLMQSLVTVRKQAPGRAMPVILDHLIERVEAGDPLYMAAKEYGAPFDEMVVGMLRAADASGEMSQVLHQLADLLERSVELRREVTGATFYPAIVFVLIMASVVVLVTVLVPNLIEPMVAQSNITLPWPTKVLIGAADFMQASWYFIVAAIIMIGVGWRMWSRIPANRVLIDHTLLRVPVLGRLLRDVAVARFTRTLGTLTASGLPILDSLRITRNTLGNAALMQAIDEVQEQVTSGKSLADPLDRCGLFPALLIQVVNLGERTGRLDQMLLHAAAAFDRQVKTSIGLFTKALPPLLLVVMAGLGGFVLAAILLPLLELQSMVG